MRRVASLVVLVPLVVACRTATAPPPQRALAPASTPARDPESARAPVPEPVDPRYARACNRYLEGYCENSDDPDAEAVSGDSLPEPRRMAVHAGCVEALQSIDASDDDITAFEACQSCNGNCIDADGCLPNPNTPWNVPPPDCEGPS